MKLPSLFFISFLITTPVFSQNFPACDSLDINCCTYNTFGPNTISLSVSNNSSVLFDYPGFVLFDSNMDTIAIETVNYFGISTGPQIHTMNIVAPLTLPLNGYLNLYILFYDTLACSFPITLPDTTTGISVVQSKQENLSVFPNPVDGLEMITINSKQLYAESLNLQIFDPIGRVVSISNIIPHLRTFRIDVTNFLPGIYCVIVQQRNKIYHGKFLKL